MAEPTPFRRSEEHGVLTVTFTRDAKLNAVSPAMIDGLRAAVDDLGDRDDLKVLVIAAEGRYFTAGIDLRDSGAGGGAVTRPTAASARDACGAATAASTC